MSERQTVQRWMITVGGVEQARVGAGQSVEIGRKPIRPLREDGFARVDIVDNKRSMSKRHALLIVDMRGMATIRDLHSTNGTYLVSANGDLLRLEPDVDFQLPDNLMRMQFGDVPVDFVRVEDSAPEVNQENSVRNLFSYVTDNACEDQPASDLSVDQILDLRAGEPTGVFHAQSVSQPSLAWQHGQTANTPLSEVTAVAEESFGEASSNNVAALPVVTEQEESPVEPRNLFADAQAVRQDVANSEVANNETVNSDVVNNDVVNNDVLSQESAAQEVAHQEASDSAFTAQEVSYTESTQVELLPENSAQTDILQDSMLALQDSANLLSISAVSAASDIVDMSNIANTSYTPAFEPGSVFEKVSKGEFDAQQNLVEVDGFTSKDAEESTNYSQQFEMAQHAELLPFLAANPGLYDDLYAWLAAQGNADVDAALARNSGYSAYRKAIEQ